MPWFKLSRCVRTSLVPDSLGGRKGTVSPTGIGVEVDGDSRVVEESLLDGCVHPQQSSRLKGKKCSRKLVLQKRPRTRRLRSKRRRYSQDGI
jgi:hypothetical protein